MGRGRSQSPGQGGVNSRGSRGSSGIGGDRKAGNVDRVVATGQAVGNNEPAWVFHSIDSLVQIDTN